MHIAKLQPLLLASAGAVHALTCATGVHIIVARGTFELPGQGLEAAITSAIVKQIPGSDVASVDYPASFAINSSLAAGVNNTQAQIATYTAACPSTKLVLMGYSQGASVIGNTLAGGGAKTPLGSPAPANDPLPDAQAQKVAAVILFGDNNRVAGLGVNGLTDTCQGPSPNPRTGSNLNTWTKYSSRLQEFCSPKDPVCCAAGSTLTAHLSYFNAVNSAAAASFVASKVGA